MITRRNLLKASAAALPANAASGRKPNFLFLIADDHAGYVLGADGNKRAQTPNLDRLAGQGMRFARHHCNSPVCTPSRQSFFTGQLPHMSGVTVLKTPLDDSKPTLAKQLKSAGYHTAVFGKMHFNRPSKPGLHGFDTMMTEQDIQRAWGGQPPSKTPPPDLKTKPRWQPFKDPARIWLNAEKLPFPRYYEEMRGTFTARKAVEFLKQNKDGPFALWASFPDPHSPYDFSIDDKDRFDAKSFAVPRVGLEDAWQIPIIFRDLSDDEKRGIIASYYTSVWQLDRNVGEVLTALNNLGLDDDTFVVYMADHGYSLGQHGRFEKHCCYDPALRVPLIMRLPGRIKPGVVNDFTESIDVPATILDMLGVDALPITHGQSLRPYLEGRRMAKPRSYVFSEYLENEEACVRTDRWKFVFCTGKRKRTDGYEIDNPTPGRYIRLYDLKKDPGEFTDVAKRESAVVSRLQSTMLERFRSTHPDAEREPKGLAAEEALEFYLRPRDA